MSGALPARPSLDRLRREARTLQRACLAGDADAAGRLAAVFPDAEPRALPLTLAQAALARGYGFAGWPALKAEVEARRAARPKSDAEVDAETLATLWLDLAEADDLRPLGRALQVGKHRKDAASAAMRRQPARYAGFQRALVRGLESRRERVRAECAHALDHFGDAATRAPLAGLMDDPVPRVRATAMHALACHACGQKPGALEPEVRDRIVAAALGDPSPRVRRTAATALALAGERSAAPVLRQMLERETNDKLLRMVAWAHDQLTRPAKTAPAGV